eukprot:CAMPEP_0176307936 /NCGR_PEP_ID=MMETSP0121_2-20121125/64281_1 /TAXON_ID=160619 /ORGANISM="Kryptoperidinium foliaceum, Strain CCMP 1326" /LENGTH=49 /DNA_ID= /DNA_START= /DNA_END= /DNA_ORIENTATION=
MQRKLGKPPACGTEAGLCVAASVPYRYLLEELQDPLPLGAAFRAHTGAA